MVKIIYNNLRRSTLLDNVVENRIADVVNRFPDLSTSHITVTLSMENSPSQAGRDSFSAKLFCHGGKFKNVVLRKDSESLYVAVAHLVDNLLERLNRVGDKSRVRKLRKARSLQKAVRHSRVS